MHWLKLVVSSCLCLIGLCVGWAWLNTGNMALGVATLACLGSGVYGIKRYWSAATDSGAIIDVKKPITRKQVNSLNIYPDKVVFEDLSREEIEKNGGQPYQCLNDNKYYYVNIFNKETNALTPFLLPDQQYYDPGVFAQRVLELPAHRKIFQRRQNTFQKLSPVILLLVIIILWILFLTTTG